jgi:hypothetical protein
MTFQSFVDHCTDEARALLGPEAFNGEIEDFTECGGNDGALDSMLVESLPDAIGPCRAQQLVELATEVGEQLIEKERVGLRTHGGGVARLHDLHIVLTHIRNDYISIVRWGNVQNVQSCNAPSRRVSVEIVARQYSNGQRKERVPRRRRCHSSSLLRFSHKAFVVASGKS